MNTLARIRFYIYTVILILVAIAMPTPEPAPMLKISAGSIASCEVAFWLGRFIQQRRPALLIAWLSLSLVLLGALLAASIRDEVRRWHQLVTSGEAT
jgi:hypothetical protein